MVDVDTITELKIITTYIGTWLWFVLSIIFLSFGLLFLATGNIPLLVAYIVAFVITGIMSMIRRREFSKL